MILGMTGPSWIGPEATPACADQVGIRRKESRQVVAGEMADRVGMGLGRFDLTARLGARFRDCETTLSVFLGDRGRLVGPTARCRFAGFVKTFPYLFSVVASTVFLLGWLWLFLPDITIPQGLLGIVLALALRRILYAGLMKYADSRSRKSGS
jgi:hypothetical protein